MADREMMKDANTDLQSESSAKTCANYNYLQAISVYDEGPKVGNYAGVCMSCLWDGLYKPSCGSASVRIGKFSRISVSPWSGSPTPRGVDLCIDGVIKKNTASFLRKKMNSSKVWKEVIEELIEL